MEKALGTCTLGLLGHRMGPPGPLGWALPSDTQVEGASEVVWIDFKCGALLWVSELWVTRTQDNTCALTQISYSVCV